MADVALVPPRVSSRRRVRQTAPSVPAPPSLRINDLLFINAYHAAGFRSPAHIDAYLQVHPGCKRASARVSAERVLQKPAVKAEIARRMQVEAGITKEMLESTLLQALAWANQKQDHLAVSSIVMDCAKLAGFLVEKREIKTLPVETTDAIRDLVRASLTPLSTTTASG